MTSELPIGWVLTQARFAFQVLNGGTPSSSEPSYWDGDICWVTPEDIGALTEKTILNSKRKITLEGYKNSGAQIAPIGSIVLTTRAPVGNVALAGIPLCTNQGCKTLIPISDSIDSTFFYYQFVARKEALNVLATGTTFQELSSSKLKGIAIHVPPLFEQRKIAEFLDQETEKIDNLTMQNRQLVDLLVEKRRAIIAHAVVYGLDTSAKFQTVNIPWLDFIPEHWNIESGRYLFTQSSLPVQDDDEIVTCFRDGQVTLRKNRREEGFTNAILELGYQGIRPGQLVLHSMDAFAGAIGVSDSAGKCSPEYIICDPANKSVFNPYYGYLLREMSLRGFIQASCPAVRERAPRIRFSDLKAMMLPVPPFEEQKAIVDHITEEISLIDELLAITTQTINLLQERRTALISEAVTGKIRVME